jgi:hypothetical protein
LLQVIEERQDDLGVDVVNVKIVRSAVGSPNERQEELEGVSVRCARARADLALVDEEVAKVPLKGWPQHGLLRTWWSLA